MNDRVTITRARGDDLDAGEGYIMSWWEDIDDDTALRQHAIYPTLEELLTALLFRFEGRSLTHKTDRSYYGKVMIERGPIERPATPSDDGP